MINNKEIGLKEGGGGQLETFIKKDNGPKSGEYCRTYEISEFTKNYIKQYGGVEKSFEHA